MNNKLGITNYLNYNFSYPLPAIEGLAVGVGFGAIGKSPSATLESAR